MKTLIKRNPSLSIFAALLIATGVLAGNLSYSPSAPQTGDSDKVMLQKSFVDIHSLATNGIANSSLYAAPAATPASSPAQGLFVQPLPGATPFSITATTPVPVANSGFTDATTLVGLRVANISKDLSAVTIDTIATVWTPTSGKKFRLMGGTISVSAAMNVLFEDNTASAGNFVFRTPKLAADTPYSFVVLGGQGKLSAAANNVLKATGSAAGNITGTLYGTEE